MWRFCKRWEIRFIEFKCPGVSSVCTNKILLRETTFWCLYDRALFFTTLDSLITLAPDNCFVSSTDMLQIISRYSVMYIQYILEVILNISDISSLLLFYKRECCCSFNKGLYMLKQIKNFSSALAFHFLILCGLCIFQVLSFNSLKRLECFWLFSITFVFIFVIFELRPKSWWKSFDKFTDQISYKSKSRK